MNALDFLSQTLRIAIPYLLAAGGGVLSERAGLIGLTLEGYMLTGAFCAAVGSYAAGAPWVGVIAAILGGGLLAMLYATSAIRFKADQVVAAVYEEEGFRAALDCLYSVAIHCWRTAGRSWWAR